MSICRCDKKTTYFLARYCPFPARIVITSYSIHYTKLYDFASAAAVVGFHDDRIADLQVGKRSFGNGSHATGDLVTRQKREFDVPAGKDALFPGADQNPLELHEQFPFGRNGGRNSYNFV